VPSPASRNDRVVGDVRAHPGGRVALHFDLSGFDVVQRQGPVGWLLDDVGCALSVVLSLVFGVGAAYAYDAGETVAAAVLALLAVPWVLAVVARFAGEIVGELLGYALLVGALLLFPLLVFPSVRRRARAWWKRPSKDAAPTGRPGDRVRVEHVRSAVVRRDGDAVTVVVHIGDAPPVAYTARGSSGSALKAEFRRTLADRISTDN
jgi:hypothetical protein